MSYGVKYRADYDTIAGVTCRVEILKKDYEGDIYPLELSGNPVIQNYQTDEPRAPIKGCSLTLSIHNTGSLPITTFYSVNDDEYKIIHYKNGQITFIGFLVQDDCSEEMVDYRHEIKLSANDNLGLLTSVSFGGLLPDTFIYDAEVSSEVSFGSYYVYIKNSAYVPIQGKPFTISGHTDPLLNDTFIPLNILTPLAEPFFYQIQVSQVLPDIVYAPVTIDSAIDLYGRNALSEIIRLCLFTAGLDLDIYVYCNLFEEHNITGRSCFEQNLVDTRSFISQESFKNCSEILEIILTRFNATLFQANGHWNIIRWDELRYGNINGFIYNSTWKLTGTTTLSDFLSFGFGQDVYPETAPIRSITRPFKYSQETFNYEQPKFLILNSNLQNLGDFLSTETIDGFRYDYYEFPASSQWLHYFPGSPFIDVSKICVKTEIATDRETERYIYDPKTNTGGVSYDHFAGVQFNDIQVSKGDKMEFSFQIKAASSTGGDSILYKNAFAILEDEGSYWSLVNGLGPLTWIHVFAPFNVNVGSLIEPPVLAADAENYYAWVLSERSNNLKVPPFPVDGVLRIRIYGSNTTSGSQPNVDTIWKDITLTIEQNIADSTNIIGHVHTDSQNENIKNNNEEIIFIDDSPRASISGTIFRNNTSGLVALRSANWYRITNDTERLRLGNITTLEELFLRRRPRTKIEGNFIGVNDIGMLARIKYSPFTSFNFVFGMLEINYKNNSFRATLFEMFEDGETDDLLDGTYVFKYLYKTK